jgi:asparagine synthetase B (glutamine-hydrolysing)
MSFLIVIDKSKNRNSVDVDLLKTKLCPYNSNIFFERINENTTLFFTNLVSRTNVIEYVPLGLTAEFRLPFNHKKDPGIAWGVISIQNQQINIETDSLGQLPLYVFEDSQRIAISCEQKAFYAIKEISVYFNFKNTDFKNLNSDLDGIKRLNPGHSIRLQADQFHVQIIKREPVWKSIKVDRNLTVDRSQQIIIEALNMIRKTYSSKITASLLSGGIDSSLATRLVESVTDTYNLKTKLGDEEEASQMTAHFLKKRTHTIDFDEDSVGKLFREVTYANEITEGLSAEIGIQLFSLLQVAGRKHKYVLTGYGADYLFGGMLKHKLYMQLTGCNDTQTLIDRAVWAKEFSPFYAWQIGVIPVHFYWNEEFIQEVLQVPLDFQFLSDFDKYLIRSAAVSEKWLTKEIAFRPKLALTNGTQMNKIFSQFLELPDEYSYDKKTRRSQEKLRSLIEL